MAVEIREALPGEEEQVLAMYEWLFAPPGATPPGWRPERAADRVAEAIAGERSAILVATDKGSLVGLCSMYIELNSVRYGRRCWIEDLAVDPGRRSQGIGAALLDVAADWAHDHRASYLQLTTANERTDAQRFYERRDPIAVGVNYSWGLPRKSSA
ncbi:MAG: hypothetical protein QOJ38_1281 [Solirubrobacterales bacterium]|jgi:GNAT superfamily N-acetyltransferase|nr:hypothetical protein [Solirubrobacterales bacterium]